jgi:hypothetical protein
MSALVDELVYRTAWLLALTSALLGVAFSLPLGLPG